MRKVLEFNDRVDEVRRQNERELLAIEARRQRNLANAEDLRRELQVAFGELESVVEKGRHRIALEHQRQTRLRSTNLRVLEDDSEKIVQHHAAEVQRLLDAEQQRSKLEEQWFHSERLRIEAERDEAIFLATLQHARRRRQASSSDSSSSGSAGEAHVASQCLSDHVPEYRYIAAHFKNGPAKLSGLGTHLKLFKVNKVHNAMLHAQFDSSTQRLAAKGLLTTGGGVGSARDRFYLGGSRAHLRHVLQFGVGATGSSSSSPGRKSGADADHIDPNAPLILFTDPACAAFAAGGTCSVLCGCGCGCGCDWGRGDGADWAGWRQLYFSGIVIA